MTEKQARRPPVAPKPSFIRQNGATTKITPQPSHALQGASLAFRPAAPTPVKASNASSLPNPSAGALLAAAAAATKKQQGQPQPQQQVQRQPAPPALLKSLEPPVTSRGRSLSSGTSSLTVSDDSTSPPKSGFRPQPPRSTSAVAAVAASAKTSPGRRPGLTRDQTGSYLARRDPSQDRRARGMSTASNKDNVQSAPKSQAALAGAIASMSTAPTQVQSLTGDKQRNELGQIAHLTLTSPQPSAVPSPSLSGTAAAATATRNAANSEARRRALSTSEEGSPSAPVLRNITLSPEPISGHLWPNIKITPPQTDSESDTVRTKADGVSKPLPAPIPIRPNHAAIVAQEQASATGQRSPLLDSRTKMTASSLADAMVASSIASTHTGSRVASPAIVPISKRRPPPIPRRRSKSVGVFEGGRHLMHLTGLKSDAGSQTPKLKPLQARPMRQTLRNTSPDHEEPTDEKRGRKHWRRHPNMHHEGDRKRWRDKVTERERKRYEGVWAANRGVLIDRDPDSMDLDYRKDGSASNDLVVNVVARDIWERSRLPKDALEEVWDLVSQPGAKALNREEFVVGMWLIDQRLKGRKLPVKVSPSVWSSVRHTQGVKISSKPLHK